MADQAESDAPPPRYMGLPFFYGWTIVAMALLCSFWGTGLIQRSYTVILKPLTDELGIPRTVGALGVTIGSLVSDVVSPFVGAVADRTGARLLISISAGMVGLSLIALSQVHEPWLFLVLFGGVIGVARPALQSVGAQAAVAKWFVRRRGRAVTFSTLGTPLSAILLIPFTEWMVASYGWRTAWLVLGAGVLLFLMAPGAIFMRSRPEDIGLLPDGDPPGTAAAQRGAAGPRRGTPPAEAEWNTKQAVRSRAFWMLSLGFAAIGMVPTVMGLHMFPHFIDQGLSPAEAAAAAGSFGFAVIGSRLLVWGQLFDRLPMERTLLIWSVLMTAAVGVMPFVDGLVLAWVAAGCFGMAMGATAPLGTLAWARYFGRTSLGAITGVANLIGIFNDIAGPLMPSIVHDVTGSYRWGFIATAVICVAGIGMFALAGPPGAPRAQNTAVGR